jgi:hypothetical protein
MIAARVAAQQSLGGTCLTSSVFATRTSDISLCHESGTVGSRVGCRGRLGAEPCGWCGHSARFEPNDGEPGADARAVVANWLVNRRMQQDGNYQTVCTQPDFEHKLSERTLCRHEQSTQKTHTLQVMRERVRRLQLQTDLSPRHGLTQCGNRPSTRTTLLRVLIFVTSFGPDSTHSAPPSAGSNAPRDTQCLIPTRWGVRTHIRSIRCEACTANVNDLHNEDCAHSLSGKYVRPSLTLFIRVL